MPPQSRAQRRRQAARQQQQQRRPPPRQPAAEPASPPLNTGSTIDLSAAPAAVAAAPRQASRTTRRVFNRSAPEPVDYTKDYDAVRRDLRWIALWTVLLFVAMIALKFSGLV